MSINMQSFLYLLLFISACHYSLAQSDSLIHQNRWMIHGDVGMFTFGGSVEWLAAIKKSTQSKWIKGWKLSYGYIPMNIAGYVSAKGLLIKDPVDNIHLELGIGPCYFTEKGDRERFPPLAAHIVARLQKPSSKVAFRMGVGFPDMLINGGIGIQIR